MADARFSQYYKGVLNTAYREAEELKKKSQIVLDQLEQNDSNTFISLSTKARKGKVMMEEIIKRMDSTFLKWNNKIEDINDDDIKDAEIEAREQYCLTLGAATPEEITEMYTRLTEQVEPLIDIANKGIQQNREEEEQRRKEQLNIEKAETEKVKTIADRKKAETEKEKAEAEKKKIVRQEEFEETEHQRKMTDLKDTSRPLNTNSNPQSLASPTVLKPLEVPTFNGNREEWTQFWSLFESLIDKRSDLTGVQKFVYLRQSLRGSAYEMISAFEVNEQTYGKACESLQKTYNDKEERLIFAQMKLNRIQSKSSSIEDQLSLCNQLRSTLLMTGTGTGSMTEIGITNIRLQIVGKFMNRIKTKAIDDGVMTLTPMEVLDKFEELIRKEISKNNILEASSPINEQRSYNSFPNSSTNRSNTGWNNTGNRSQLRNWKDHRSPIQNQTATPNRFASMNNCVYCGKHADSTACRTVTTQEDRLEQLRLKKLCNACLQPGHRATSCTINCAKCAGQHHESICPRNRSPPRDQFPSTPRGRFQGHDKRMNRNPLFTPRTSNNRQVNFTHDEEGEDDEEEQILLSQNEQITLTDPDRDDLANVGQSNNGNRPVRLMTAHAEVADPLDRNRAHIDILLDTGSSLNIISSKVVKDMGLKTAHSHRLKISGIGGTSKGTTDYDVTHITVGGITVEATVMDDPLTAPMRTEQLPDRDKQYIHAHHIVLADDPTRSRSIQPQLILGIEAHNLLIGDSPQKVTMPSGLVLWKTPMGHVVSGRSTEESQYTGDDPRETAIIQHPSMEHTLAQYCLLVTNNSFENRVSKFLGIDDIGKEDGGPEKELKKLLDKEAEQHFLDNMVNRNNEYSVKYFLKKGGFIPDNFGMAVKRLQANITNLSKNSIYMEAYDRIIKEQLSAGQVEEVINGTQDGPIIHYLPHQGVIRKDKVTTPIRVVFDASSHTRNKDSLNDIIHEGPNLLEEIPAILIRARSCKHIITADVEKAFLQIRLDKSQRDMVRFLWVKDITQPVTQSNIIFLRFTVTPFGVNQSPFLLNRVIQHHITSSDLSNDIKDQIHSNTYVDNVIFACDKPEQRYYKPVKKVFEAMHMNLREFTSSSEQFNEMIADKDKGKEGVQKLLGIKWDPKSDEIILETKSATEIKYTKRGILSFIAGVFDPLGFISPLTLKTKLFLQSLWNKELSWDTQLEQEDQHECERLIGDILKFHSNISRYTHLSEGAEITLVLFSDASNSAMGAVVYSHTDTANSILLSRTRLVSRNSKPTIPKAELSAYLMGFCMLKYIVNAIRKQFPQKPIHIFTYCDSTTVLHWIEEQKSYKMGPYVGNRIKGIASITKELSEDSNTTLNSSRYVKTDDNPADVLTRGLTADEMMEQNSIWWSGPVWLRYNPTQWPQLKLPPGHGEQSEQAEVAIGTETHTTPIITEPVINFSRFSSLNKAINTTVFVHRFISRMANRSKNTVIIDKLEKYRTEEVTITPRAHERDRALETLIRVHQSCHNLEQSHLSEQNLIKQDGRGIWRGNKGTLENSRSPAEFKYPIYLPIRNRSFIDILIRNSHETLYHSGTDTVLNDLRTKFWIPKGRQIVKNVMKSCIICKKANNKPFKYPDTPPLPEQRLQREHPFSNCGMDYIGPFNSKDSEKKYILLITCLGTRATHLEVTETMETTSFIQAFRRFCARRGVPTYIVSDKAPTFKTAEAILCMEQLHSHMEQKKIKWKYTTAHAPWQGGVYERLVGCVKQAFNKAMGNRKLSSEELNTVTTEIEAVLNSRPLGYVPSEQDNSPSHMTIRPIDFITPNLSLNMNMEHLNIDDSYMPPEEMRLTKNIALKKIQRSIQVVDKFWNMWLNTYMTSIRDSNRKPDYGQKVTSPKSPSIGDIVLIMDENRNVPRNQWNMGRILNVQGHTVTLRSIAGRTIERPQNLLIPLELSCEDQ